MKLFKQGLFEAEIIAETVLREINALKELKHPNIVQLLDHGIDEETKRNFIVHVISLVGEDGAPVSPKRLKKERQQAAKEKEAAERKSALQVGGEPTAGAERYFAAGSGWPAMA